MRLLNYSWVLVVGLLSLGCDQVPKEDNKKNQSSDFVRYPLEIEVDHFKKLPKEKRKLLRRLNAGEAISFDQVTNLIIEGHDLDDQPDRLIREIVEEVDFVDPHQFKVEYEAFLKSVHDGKSLKYRVSATNLAEPLTNNRVQASSGSLLFNVLSRYALGPKKFRAQNLVMIFEAGHMLPGQMVRNEDGEWELLGLETTTKGPSRVEYGLVSELHELEKVVRIVDAEIFAVVEVFKDSSMTYPGYVLLQALRYTAELYGIEVSKIEKRLEVLREEDDFYAVQDRALDSSLFGFGVSLVEDKDFERHALKLCESEDERPKNGGADGSLLDTKVIQDILYEGRDDLQYCEDGDFEYSEIASEYLDHLLVQLKVNGPAAFLYVFRSHHMVMLPKELPGRVIGIKLLPEITMTFEEEEVSAYELLDEEGRELLMYVAGRSVSFIHLEDHSIVESIDD